ncbi:hypothetical protein [Clostridium butyricum]|nr:hypothetical protein [Clostridium butyricum]
MESKEKDFNNEKLTNLKKMILDETENLSLNELEIILYGIMRKTNTIM